MCDIFLFVTIIDGDHVYFYSINPSNLSKTSNFERFIFCSKINQPE
jgi:hypothetical protein